MTAYSRQKIWPGAARLLGLTAAAFLSACGGGEPEPEVGLIKVSHQGSGEMVRYEMQEQGGDLLQQGSLTCRTPSQCEIPTSVRSSGPVKLRFYDRNNKLLTAYELPELSAAHAHVSTSDAMLGTQIFDDLRAKFDYTIPDLTARLDHFFMEIDSPDGTIDFFEELGQYFQAQVHGAGMSEAAFLDDLKAALDSYQVLPAPAAPLLRSFASASGSDSLVCTKGGDLAVDVVGDVIGEIPVIGSIFGTLFKGLVKSGCETAEEVLGGKLDNISGQISVMSAKLNELASKLDSLGVRIDKLGEMLNDSIIQDRINDFNKNFVELKRAVDTYNGVIYASKSLSGYVQAVGGLNKDNLAKYPRLTDLLKSDNVLAQRDLYEAMVDRDNLNSLASALVTKCANANAISGDAIQVRQYCLYVLATITSKAMLIQSSAAAMLVDKMEVLGVAMRDAPNPEYQNWLRGNFYTIPGIEDVEARRNEIANVFSAGVANLGNAFTPRGQSVLPVPLQGFSHPNFLATLKDFGCTFGPNQGNRVAVLQWMPKDKVVLLQCKYQGMDVWSKIRMAWGDDFSRYSALSMGVPQSPFAHEGTKWDETQAPFFRVDSTVPDAYNGRPQSKDFYADPQRFLLEGTRRLSLKPSSRAPGYYQTDWSAEFEDPRYTKIMRVRYTGKPVDGFALSHVFAIGFRYQQTKGGSYYIDAQVQCVDNPNCSMVEGGVRVTDGSAVNTIAFSNSRYNQLVFDVK